MTRGFARATVVLAVLGAPMLSAQQSVPGTAAPPSTGLILGRALDGDGRPLAGAEISLNKSAVLVAPADPTAPPAPSAFPMRVQTGAGGYFLFHDLPKGSYLVNGTRDGYLATAYGRRTPTDTGTEAIGLGDGEKRSDVDVTFWKSATLSGSVVDEAGEPLIGVPVEVLRRTVTNGRPVFLRSGGVATTDDRGIYRAAGLLPGSYVVAILNTTVTGPTALQVYLGDAQRTNTYMEATREMERSQPTLSFGPQAGQRIGSWLVGGSAGLNGLPNRQPPAPVLQSGKVFVYPTVFYPAAPSAGRATAIVLGSGEDRTGVDFQLRPVPTSQISGTVTGLTGPEALMTLRLEPAGQTDAERNLQLATATTISDASGAFLFLGVPAGSYTIHAVKVPPRPQMAASAMTVIQTSSGGMISSSMGPGPSVAVSDDPTASATMPITVGDTDIADVAISLSPGVRVTGHVDFDPSSTAGRPTGDQLRAMYVSIQPADGSLQVLPFQLVRASVDTGGLIKSYQFPPGQYVVRANPAPPGWLFKSASVGGRDVADAPLELRGEDVTDLVVTLTDRLSELSGTARDHNGREMAAAVVIFPADAKQWINYGTPPRRVRTARVGTDGTYTVAALPAGDYLVAALHDNVSQDWTDPAFLAKVAPLATHVTIADRETKSLDLTAVEVH